MTDAKAKNNIAGLYVQTACKNGTACLRVQQHRSTCAKNSLWVPDGRGLELVKLPATFSP